jgi:PKHD-type hydroxylase
LDHLNYYYFSNVFTDKEIEKIIQLGDTFPKQTAQTGGGADGRESKNRISEIAWITETPESEWLYSRITDLAMTANANMWNYDIWGYHDSLQYTTYYDAGGHYDWHADVGPNMSNRKLSCVIQLTDPSEYEGGELQFQGSSGVVSLPKEKGMVVFFSSFVLHRVTPVLTGTRKSLVTWLSGPQYK